jgi:hypothetical protein
MPVNTPEEFTVAWAVLLLDHVPPVVDDASVALAPTHAVVVPVSDAGTEFTVTNVLAAQLVGNVYTTVAKPAVSPVTNPVEVPTFIEELTLLQLPPPAASVSNIDEPTHTGTEPRIVAGNGFTVITLVL